MQARHAQVPTQKPTGISLIPVGDYGGFDKAAVRPRISVALLSTAVMSAAREIETHPGSCVKLYDKGNGLFSLRIDDPAGNNRLSKDVIAELTSALDKLRQERSLKVLMIGSAARCFLRGSRDEYNDAVSLGLYRAIASFPYPVIAVVQGDAASAGFLAAALCDFLVCSEDANYRYTDASVHFYPTALEADLLGKRFGPVQVREFLYLAKALPGSQMRARGWTCPILPEAQVEMYAERLAAELVEKPQEALRLLKQHLTSELAGMVEQLMPVESGSFGEEIGLTSSDVLSDVLIVKIPFALSPQSTLAHLGEAVAQAERNTGYKAIVLASESADYCRSGSGSGSRFPASRPGIASSRSGCVRGKCLRQGMADGGVL